jgi:hypothetical protein
MSLSLFNTYEFSPSNEGCCETKNILFGELDSALQPKTVWFFFADLLTYV